MGDTTVIFSHGKESGPWGKKISRLAPIAEEVGCAVVSVDYRGVTDPLERVRMLVEASRRVGGGVILVGSSMGGAVSLAAASQVDPLGLFLMAPAIGIPGYPPLPPLRRIPPTLIVHGTEDAIVPPGPVMEYARLHGMELVMLPDGHTLEGSLDTLADLFRRFLAPLTERRSAVPPSPGDG